jgi:hypothetical protein
MSKSTLLTPYGKLPPFAPKPSTLAFQAAFEVSFGKGQSWDGPEFQTQRLWLKSIAAQATWYWEKQANAGKLLHEVREKDENKGEQE